MGVIKYIKEEMKIVRERDPAIKSRLRCFYIPALRLYVIELPIGFIAGNAIFLPDGYHKGPSERPA